MSIWIEGAAVFAALAGFLVGRWLVASRAEARRRMRARAGVPVDVPIVPRGLLGKVHARKEKERLHHEVERHVPEMLDAVALGMRSGLSFESAFKLYASRFEDDLALACRRACQSWESGLVGRDEALRRLAAELDVPALSRFVSNIQRALRFGSPIGRMLESLSSEARSCYRATMEERVAKTPVKMLGPTAGLILPAMLILMMGPVMLDLVG